MKKSIQDLKESLRKKEEKQQRLHEQEETVKKDIRVLRYLIAKAVSYTHLTLPTIYSV